MSNPEDQTMSLITITHNTPPFSELKPREKLKMMSSILRKSLPLILALNCGPIANIINQIWLTGYNSDDLVAAFGVSYIWCSSSVGILIFTLNQGLGVLIAQAFGAKEYRLCGIYLQRGFIVLFSIILPFFILLWFSAPIMIAIGIAENLAEISQQYTRLMIPSLIGSALFDLCKTFMVGQKVFDPVIYIQLTTLGMHCFWSYLFIHVLQMGVAGAALCRFMEDWANLALAYSYIRKSQRFDQNLIPMTREALDCKAILGQIKFTIPIAAINYVEFIFFEAMMIMSGTFGTIQTVTHIALSQTSSLIYLCYLGVSITMTSLIGNSFGEKNILAAKNFLKAGTYTIMCIYFTYLAFIALFRYQWILLFTSNPEIIELFMQVIWVLSCVNLLCDAIVNSSLAVLKTAEMQDTVNKWTIICLYGIGLPLMILFAFYLHHQTAGLWYGFCIANVIMTLIFMKMIKNLNWEEVIAKIHSRLAQNKNDLHDLHDAMTETHSTDGNELQRMAI
jgi:MATE family multidrug resistance protein